MSNFWTVRVNKDDKVLLENESYPTIKLALEGSFQNQDTQILFASNLARKLNGSLNDIISGTTV
jgi:hypothetical protein